MLVYMKRPRRLTGWRKQSDYLFDGDLIKMLLEILTEKSFVTFFDYVLRAMFLSLWDTFATKPTTEFLNYHY